MRLNYSRKLKFSLTQVFTFPDGVHTTPIWAWKNFISAEIIIIHQFLEKIYQIVLNDLSFPEEDPLGQEYSTITLKMLTSSLADFVDCPKDIVQSTCTCQCSPGGGKVNCQEPCSAQLHTAMKQGLTPSKCRGDIFLIDWALTLSPYCS